MFLCSGLLHFIICENRALILIALAIHSLISDLNSNGLKEYFTISCNEIGSELAGMCMQSSAFQAGLQEGTMNTSDDTAHTLTPEDIWVGDVVQLIQPVLLRDKYNSRCGEARGYQDCEAIAGCLYNARTQLCNGLALSTSPAGLRGIVVGWNSTTHFEVEFKPLDRKHGYLAEVFDGRWCILAASDVGEVWERVSFNSRTFHGQPHVPLAGLQSRARHV